jgi:hypothetical protein
MTSSSNVTVAIRAALRPLLVVHVDVVEGSANIRSRIMRGDGMPVLSIAAWIGSDPLGRLQPIPAMEVMPQG